MVEDAEPGASLWARSAVAVLRAVPDMLAVAEIPAGLIIPHVGLVTVNAVLRDRMADDPQLRPLLVRQATAADSFDAEAASTPAYVFLVRDECVTTDARSYRILEFAHPQAPDQHLLICRLPRAELPAPAYLRARLGFTLQEARIAVELAHGLSNHAIARKIGVSERTVRHHVEQIMRKLATDSRTAAAAVIWRASAR